MTGEGEHVPSFDAGALELARTLGTVLRRRRLTLSVAESATGGLISHLVTEVPGSSDYFAGGIVAYSNAVKTDLLHVPKTLLDRHGAVSAETTVAMAQGIRKLVHSDVGLASSGIAGPSGATPSKPVGLVYVAVELPVSDCVVRRYEFKGSRSDLKALFARAAIELLLECLEKRAAAP